MWNCGIHRGCDPFPPFRCASLSAASVLNERTLTVWESDKINTVHGGRAEGERGYVCVRDEGIKRSLSHFSSSLRPLSAFHFHLMSPVVRSCMRTLLSLCNPMNDPFPFPHSHVKFPSGGAVTDRDLPLHPCARSLSHPPCFAHRPSSRTNIVLYLHVCLHCVVVKTAFIHLQAGVAAILKARERDSRRERPNAFGRDCCRVMIDTLI